MVILRDFSRGQYTEKHSGIGYGVKLILRCVLVIPIFVWINFVIFDRYSSILPSGQLDSGSIFAGVVMLIVDVGFVVAFVYLLIRGLLCIIAGGEWMLIVDESSLRICAPATKISYKVNIPLENIEKIQSRTVEGGDDWYLLLKGGEPLYLKGEAPFNYESLKEFLVNYCKIQYENR